jgi:eukaryotic-like serine/threonine-protein kinase
VAFPLLPVCLLGFGTEWSSLAWGQTDGSPAPGGVGQLLENPDTLLSSRTMQHASYLLGALIVLFLLIQAVRVLKTGRPRGRAAPSRRANLRAARRAFRRGDYLQAGEHYEAAEHWEGAAEAYEAGRSYAKAGLLWERLGTPDRAARLYEQASELTRAAELYARTGSPSRAASLYQRSGQELKAAEIYERAGELDRAAALFVKHEIFDRAADLLARKGQPAQAAELFERGLRRAVVSQGPIVSPEALRVRPVMARRCAELYAQAGQPAKAAAVLREHGQELDAAEYYCQAGDWETGLDLFLRHREYERAMTVCKSLGAEDRLHVVRGERLIAEGRDRAAAREFEAAKAWARAAELFERTKAYDKAAEMYARHGDDERAAEMYAAAGQPLLAGQAFERLGKVKEAARCYQQAGETLHAAQMLKVGGDLYGAARLLLQGQAVDEAVAVLQQIGPQSERYLEATLALGELFLQRQLYGPAKEKFERVAALRPISREFVHPTYQLAMIAEREGELRKALTLFEKVMAEQFAYRDVQPRVAALRERLAQATQVLGPGDTPPGAVVGPGGRSRYQIVRELGRGGMGTVYLAEDQVLQRLVAYKVLGAEVRGESKSPDYFLREARIAAALQHPNIVTIYDAGQDGADVYIAMEYVEGSSLQQRLDETPILPLPRGLGIFRQACKGLAHAHAQNVVHRDVKPANMMLTGAGVVKLTDFGLAAVVSGAKAMVSSVRGTPHYMAPEQILGEEISALTDQYALGCTLYRMLTGRPPFTEGDVLYHHVHSAPAPAREWNPQIPAWLEAIILRAMDKDRTRRFPSVEALLEELDRCLTGGRGIGGQAGDGTR